VGVPENILHPIDNVPVPGEGFIVFTTAPPEAAPARKEKSAMAASFATRQGRETAIITSASAGTPP
jgi:hypothetical protein